MKHIARTLAALMLLAMLCPPYIKAAGDVTVYLDGSPTSGSLPTLLSGGTSYISLKALADRLGAELSWNAVTRTAVMSCRGLKITAQAGAQYLTANGRAVYVPGGLPIRGGRMLIPTRAAALCLNGTAAWDGASRRVYITSGVGFIPSGDEYYDPDELYWLSRIISAESRGEPLSGQIAVGNVILNRVSSRDYPNTIWGVIFDRKYGVQFEPVLNGTVYADPAAISVTAAKLCLEGVDLSRGSIYFYDPAIAQSSWIGANRPYVMTIGNHYFYA